MLKGGINPSNLDNYWGYGVFMILTAIMLVIATGAKNLSRTGTRLVHQPHLR
jgi:hypothetical protein